MVEVADATEVAEYGRAMSELPAVALGAAMAGAGPEVTADLVGQINLSGAGFTMTHKSLITRQETHTCRGLNGARDRHKGHPARTATIVTLQMQQTARPTSHGVAILRDLRYAKTDLYRRRTFLDGPALSKPE
jgi:hypothetical protein